MFNETQRHYQYLLIYRFIALNLFDHFVEEHLVCDWLLPLLHKGQKELDVLFVLCDGADVERFCGNDGILFGEHL